MKTVSVRLASRELELLVWLMRRENSESQSKTIRHLLWDQARAKGYPPLQPKPAKQLA